MIEVYGASDDLIEVEGAIAWVVFGQELSRVRPPEHNLVHSVAALDTEPEG